MLIVSLSQGTMRIVRLITGYDAPCRWCSKSVIATQRTVQQPFADTLIVVFNQAVLYAVIGVQQFAQTLLLTLLLHLVAIQS